MKSLLSIMPMLLLTCMVSAQSGSSRVFGSGMGRVAMSRAELLSFGEFPFGRISHSVDLPATSWRIYDHRKESIVKTGRGEELLKHVFHDPGEYTVEFDIPPPHINHDGSCYHPDLPERMDFKIHRALMRYEEGSLELSLEIRGGEDCNGILLSIKVEIQSYDGEAVEVPVKIESFGVDAYITGDLEESMRVLEPGVYELQYRLRGTARKGTYIGFYFYHPSGKISAYSMKRPVL